MSGSGGGHLIEIAGDWQLWRCAAVRGAGFPASIASSLAAPEAALAADRVLELELEVEAAIASLSALLLRELEASGSPELRKALKKVRAGKPLEAGAASLSSGLAGANTRLAGALDQLRAARARADEVLAAENVRVSAFLRALASSGPFREAMIWQNRAAVRRIDEVFSGSPLGATDSSTRKQERLIASYVQRYCLKNDTIGFFGPVGWATLSGDGPALSVSPGPSLLDRRTVYFEYWCVDALADRLAAEPALKRHLAPRRAPSIRIDGTTLHAPIERTATVPPEFARALAACDGERSALAIAEELAADPALELSSPDEALELLQQLADKRLITWTLELPTAGVHAERDLRRYLERLPDEPPRRDALATLDELEASRDAVARAAGDPDRLEPALASAEATVERLTGASATRRAGATYAGRTPLYEECRRDLALTVGPDLLARLGPPLSLVLSSARWYTHSIASAYRQALTAIYQRQRGETGSSIIDYFRFFQEASGLFSGDATAPPVVREVVAELHRRWAELLGVTGEPRLVRRSAAELRGAVEDAFAAPDPGWPQACYQSPDVMIAASSAAAVARGDYQLVLGELHAGFNSLCSSTFLHQHPALGELVRALDEDLPTATVSVAQAKDRFHHSLNNVSLSQRRLEVETGRARSSRPRDRVLAVSELVIDERDGRIEVRTRDGRFHFPLEVFFEQHMLLDSGTRFSLLPSAPHTPRVVIDDLIIQREEWRLEPSVLAFAWLDDAGERFRAARKWARERSLPRFLFMRIPEEIKPCYVDAESPIYVELWSRLVRKASAVTLSEMVPGPQQLWLPDANGQVYVAELRIPALAGRRPARGPA